jgi:uncharacterized protein with PIN domain
MEPRFAVDVMLGSLARWLRLLGYDTLYFNEAEDVALAAEARRRKRVLVTRDRQLAGRRSTGRVVLIRSQRLREQWLELVRVCDLRPRRARVLTRCGDCNTRVSPLSRETARRLVPPYVHATRRRFRRCPTCGRVFWRATHVTGIASRLEELLEAARRASRDSGPKKWAGRSRKRKKSTRTAVINRGSGARGRRARRSP